MAPSVVCAFGQRVAWVRLPNRGCLRPAILGGYRHKQAAADANKRADTNRKAQLVQQSIKGYIGTLNDEQKDAVLCPTPAIRIKAGPGSGKTRVITARTAHLISQGLPASKLCIITFTNKAAKELRERITGLLGMQQGHAITTGTFHGLAVRILRRYIDRLHSGLTKEFTIYDPDECQGIMRKVLQGVLKDSAQYCVPARGSGTMYPWMDDTQVPVSKGKQPAKPKAPAEPSLPPGLLQEHLNVISKVHNQIPTAYGQEPLKLLQLHSQLLPANMHKHAHTWAEFAQRKMEANAVDFDDIISLTVAVLQHNPGVLAALRERWQHVLVDEFQDTNAGQYELVRLLAGHGPSMTGNVFVVGDENQAIYGWRGADPSNMSEKFLRDWPDAKTLSLVRNYRSRPHVTEASEHVLSFNAVAGRRAQRMVSMQDPGGSQDRLNAIKVDDASAESITVARLARELHETQKIPYSEMAVLYRTNKQSRPFEESFSTQGIPFRVVGAIAFWDRKEIRDVTSYLRLALSPRTDIAALRCAIGCQPCGLGPATVEKLLEMARQRAVPLPALLFEDCVDVWLGAEQTERAVQLALKLDSAIAWQELLGVPAVESAIPPSELKLTKGARDGLQALRALVVLLRNAARYMPLEMVVQAGLVASGYRVHLETGTKDDKERILDRLSNLRELRIIAREPEKWLHLIQDLDDNIEEATAASRSSSVSGEGSSDSLPELSNFISYIKLIHEASGTSKREKVQDGTAAEEVTLCTLHSAKGLEWRVVFLVGCIDGVLPMVARGDEDVSEEKRLAYVGMTRAKDHLYLLSSGMHNQYGKVIQATPSPFLTHLEKQLKSNLLLTNLCTSRQHNVRNVQYSRPSWKYPY